MSSLTTIASSGLSAARMRLDASAGNVANMNTPGYRAQRVVQQAAPEGGVDASAEGVSLEQEVVDQLAAKQAFMANLQTLRTGDAVLGALLDVRV